jgi:CRISPR/Cas system-associated exonuclease Cas4 (RecB family)
MGLKKVFNSMKDEGIVLPKLNKHLLAIGQDVDRNHGFNSPSAVSSCPRSNYFTRMGISSDGVIEPRLRRIFDNGHGVHDRLQGYLQDEGMLLMPEVPVWNSELKILGHTDGILRVNRFTLAILEIKSINSNGYAHLTTAKPEHQMQAQVYMYCLEELRKKLVTADTEKKYLALKKKLLSEYGKLMDSFVVGGSKFTKEEKIAHKLEIMGKVIDILYNTPKRIDTMSVIYENKDTQDIKEYVIKWDDELVENIIDRYEYLNNCVINESLPPRPEEAPNKSSQYCRYCNYKYQCWH